MGNGLKHKRRSSFVLLALLACTSAARTNRQAEIDAYCQQVREQFREIPPAYFSGPDPWVPIAEPPAEAVDAAIAAVYMDGTKVERVVLEMDSGTDKESGNGWYESTDYYFDAEGKVAKRERHLEQPAANAVVDEQRYYNKGKLFKNQFTHHALAKGKEDWSQLFDPKAPEYLSTRDLPFPAVATRQRLAQR